MFCLTMAYASSFSSYPFPKILFTSPTAQSKSVLLGIKCFNWVPVYRWKTSHWKTNNAV